MLFRLNAEILDFFKLLAQFVEFFAVKAEEFAGNFFHTEGIFKIVQRGVLRICRTVCNKTAELRNCSMARLVLPNEIRIPLCRGHVLGSLQFAVLKLHLIIEAHEGQPPFRFAFGIKSDKCSICVGVLNQFFCIASLCAPGIFDISGFLQLYRHDNNALFIRRLVIAYMDGAFNVRGKICEFLSELIRRYNADIGEYFPDQVNIAVDVVRILQY